MHAIRLLAPPNVPSLTLCLRRAVLATLLDGIVHRVPHAFLTQPAPFRAGT